MAKAVMQFMELVKVLTHQSCPFLKTRCWLDLENLRILKWRFDGWSVLISEGGNFRPLCIMIDAWVAELGPP